MVFNSFNLYTNFIRFASFIANVSLTASHRHSIVTVCVRFEHIEVARICSSIHWIDSNSILPLIHPFRRLISFNSCIKHAFNSIQYSCVSVCVVTNWLEHTQEPWTNSGRSFLFSLYQYQLVSIILCRVRVRVRDEIVSVLLICIALNGHRRTLRSQLNQMGKFLFSSASQKNFACNIAGRMEFLHQFFFLLWLMSIVASALHYRFKLKFETHDEFIQSNRFPLSLQTNCFLHSEKARIVTAAPSQLRFELHISLSLTLPLCVGLSVQMTYNYYHIAAVAAASWE